MKSETNNHRKYVPPVTLTQLLNFDPKNPATHTASPFINAFMKIFCETHALDKDIAEMMELSLHYCSCIFSVETGMSMRDFHNYWLVRRINAEIDKNPKIDGDELARKVGYSDRSGLWRFYNSKTYKRIARELGLRIFPKPVPQVHH